MNKIGIISLFKEKLMNFGVPESLMQILKPTLGFMRVFLAFMVLDWHFGYYQKFILPHIKNFAGPGNIYFLGDGRLAVFGFFVISGFLIASILEEKYKAAEGKDFIAFFASRFLRILPLFWLILTCYLILSGQEKIKSIKGLLGNYALFPAGIWSFFLDTRHSLPLDDHLFIGSTWTLSLDLVFYVLAPFIVWMWIRSRVHFWIIFLSLTTYFLVFLFPFSFSGTSRDISGHFNIVYTTGELAFFTFLLGMLCFWYREKINTSWVTAVLGFLALIYVLYFPVFIENSFEAFSLGILSICLIVVFLYKNGNSNLEQFLSNFTFAVYLVHRPIIRHVKWEHGYKTLLQNLPLSLLVFGVSVSLGILLSIFFENPIEKHRKKLVKLIPNYQIRHDHLTYASYVILISLLGVGAFSAYINFQ